MVGFYDTPKLMQKLLVGETSGPSFLCPVFTWVLMLVGHPCEYIDGFKLAKKVFWGERWVNFLQIWLLETAYYKNIRAVAKEAAGEAGLFCLVAASCGLGSPLLNKQTNKTVSLDIIVAGRKFCAFNHPWKLSFSGD